MDLANPVLSSTSTKTDDNVLSILANQKQAEFNTMLKDGGRMHASLYTLE